eukprot:Awhi_evm1s15815
MKKLITCSSAKKSCKTNRRLGVWNEIDPDFKVKASAGIHHFAWTLNFSFTFDFQVRVNFVPNAKSSTLMGSFSSHKA